MLLTQTPTYDKAALKRLSHVEALRLCELSWLRHQISTEMNPIFI
jgi:hypothetical protein